MVSSITVRLTDYSKLAVAVDVSVNGFCVPPLIRARQANVAFLNLKQEKD